MNAFSFQGLFDNIGEIRNRPLLFLMVLAAGLILGTVVYAVKLKHAKLKPSAALFTLLFGIPLAVILSKLVYVAFNYGAVIGTYGIQGLIRTNPEEFSFFSGCAGFLLGAFFAIKSVHIRHLERALDCLALPFCLIVAFARFGTLFLYYNGVVDMPLFTFINIPQTSPIATFPLVMTRGLMPFLAIGTIEALFALGCAAASAIRGVTRRVPGLLFEETLFMLCAFQLFFELLHSVSFIFFFVHVEQVFCAITMLILMIRACQLHGIVRKRWPVASLIFFVLTIAVNGVTQFFMDKPYIFTEPLPEGIRNWIEEGVHTGIISCVLLALTTVLMIVLYRRLNTRVKKSLK